MPPPDLETTIVLAATAVLGLTGCAEQENAAITNEPELAAPVAAEQAPPPPAAVVEEARNAETPTTTAEPTDELTVPPTEDPAAPDDPTANGSGASGAPAGRPQRRRPSVPAGRVVGGSGAAPVGVGSCGATCGANCGGEPGDEHEEE